MDATSDPGYLQFRRNSVRLASACSLVAVAMIAAYLLATWDEPNRGPLLGISAAVVVIVALIQAAHAERLVATRWSDAFFGAWSAAYVVVISAMALLDGGAGSPLVITFFAPLVFAAACYPLRLALYVGVAVLAAHVAIALGTAHGDDAGSLYVTGVLALAATMCVWQASTLDRQRRELALASRTDYLTGALNRRGLTERTEQELARAARSGEAVSIVLVDLDGFKRVNDLHGHGAGDDLLRWVADRLRAGLRPSDAAGRLGGDEFALLLPGIDAAGASAVAERLRTVLAERTSGSFGAAAASSGGVDASTLIARADEELYRDKQLGRALDVIQPPAVMPGERWY